MIFSTLVSLSALPALAYAQYGGYGGGGGSPSPATTSQAPASAPSAPADGNGTMNIDVGFNGGFVFHPANITAPVGTLVTFWFPVGNNGPHSVTQSSFADPCTFLQANSSANTGAGFDSGLQSATTFTINVTDSSPIWFHCKQITHCGMGMVGSINAPTNGSNTFDAFMSAAKNIGTSEPIEQDNGPVLSGVHASAVASPTPSSTGGTANDNSNNGAASLAPAAFIATLLAGAVAFAL